MIEPTMLNEIKDDGYLAYLVPKIIEFDNYLEQTKHLKLKHRGFEIDDETVGDNITSVMYENNYKHRWQNQYLNHRLYQLYNLKYRILDDDEIRPKYTMMITCTGSHSSPRNPLSPGLKHLQYLDKFCGSLKKHKDMVKRYLDSSRYLTTLEPHPKSGYVHSHTSYLLDNEPIEGLSEILENHWNNKLKMGTKEHGLKVDIKEVKRFDDIKNVVSYLFGYVSPAIVDNVGLWSKEYWVFNTCIWLSSQPKFKGGLEKIIRTFQPSRELLKLMKVPTTPYNKVRYQHLDTRMFSDRLLEPITMNRDKHFDGNFPWYRNFDFFDEIGDYEL